MRELETIELEGKEYIIRSEIILQGSKYIHLTSSSDPEDFCIRKIRINDGKEMLVGLDSEQEFNMALEAFSSKYKEDFEI